MINRIIAVGLGLVVAASVLMAADCLAELHSGVVQTAVASMVR